MVFDCRSEIEELQAKISKEREAYQESTFSNMMELSAISLIPVNSTVCI